MYKVIPSRGIRTILFCYFTLAFSFACTNDRAPYTEGMISPESEMAFDQEKWQMKEGKDYPYREKMLNTILYNDSIRSLSKSEILVLLGKPSYYREDKSYLHYRIKEQRLFSWKLHTQTMVIKLTEQDSIEWIKVHG